MISALIIRSSTSQLPNGQRKSNLGDLLRSTVLLSCLPSDSVWLTDPASVPLLSHFLSPERILTFEQLRDARRAERIYYLDNVPVPAPLQSLVSGEWRGFADTSTASRDLLRLTEAYSRSDSPMSWQEALVRGCGFEWLGQDYALPRTTVTPLVDVGLNWLVHPEWTSKMWPRASWEALATTLSRSVRVSWQEGATDLDTYVRWIASCKSIITCETLGLHLASAFRRQVTALTGPATGREFPYDRITLLTPSPRPCMPCNSPTCSAGSHCLTEITPEAVFTAWNSRFRVPNPHEWR